MYTHGEQHYETQWCGKIQWQKYVYMYARIFVLFDGHVNRGVEGGGGEGHRTWPCKRVITAILIIRRREWIYVSHCIREITGNAAAGFVVWRVKSMTNGATKATKLLPHSLPLPSADIIFLCFLFRLNWLHVRALRPLRLPPSIRSWFSPLATFVARF